MPIGTDQNTLHFKSVNSNGLTATFIGASANTVIDTFTHRLGIGVDSNGPTSNLHVVGNAYVTSDLTAVGNVEASKFIGDGSLLTGLASNLHQAVESSNITSNTIQLTNATTGLIATGNVKLPSS